MPQDWSHTPKLRPILQVIAKAKVPIVKFDDVATGLAFDISFDVANGPKAAEYVVKVMKGLPGMLQLVKILKLFLQQRELNEVYIFLSCMPFCPRCSVT